MPGLAGGRKILTVNAAGSDRAAALASYMTNPESVPVLVSLLRLPSGKLPDSFQVLTRAEYQSQGLLNVVYVTHRPPTGLSGRSRNLAGHSGTLQNV